ncbi:MAG: hypothetical protein IKS37_03905 [Solobacterium sp.]|nr:hypothetical protein [Solobacterium sp.]
MEENTNMNIDVTKIMEEIRADIDARGLRDEVLSFEEIPMPQQATVVDSGTGPFNNDEFMDSNMYMNRCFQVQTWQPIKSNRPLGFLIIFFKKIIRKLIRFFIDPIVNEQNDFNANTTRSMNQVRNYIHETSTKNTQTEDAVKAMQLRMETMSREITELNRKVAALEEENRSLRKDAE